MRDIRLLKFLDQYKGIEGFYFLNNTGELGYINADHNPKSIKETFPQLKNKKFVQSHPRLMSELEDFIREIGNLSRLYLGSPVRDMELGYVLPASNEQDWQSATLVLHKHVLESMRSDQQLLAMKGMKEAAEAEREIVRIKAFRSICQGFDDLISYQDPYGVHKYFPVLFYKPNHRGIGSDSKLRVINLRWRKNQYQPNESTLISTHDSRETIFSVLAGNLVERGAIHPAQKF